MTRLRHRIIYLPVLRRVLIANSIVIIIGAVGGTLLTRYLALLGNLWLILLFASLGILLTLLVNYWILKTSLHPLHELRTAVIQVRNGQTSIPESPMMRADPDIHSLIVAMNAMLERLEVRTSQLRALSDRVISVQEDERKRIARALHDDTSQAVSTLLIQLERMEDELPANQVAVRRRLVEARGLASAMLDDLRKNIWDLRPTILDDLGLVPAIRWYARMRLQETGVQVSFDMDEDIRPEPYLETLLFRMSQEAVGNILRHAEAKNVIIRLMKDYSRVCLEVEDDGRGFNVEHTVEEAVSHKQLGLLGIHEQASLVGGEAKIDSAPGRGTRVHVCIPLLTGAQMNREGTGPNKVEV